MGKLFNDLAKDHNYGVENLSIELSNQQVKDSGPVYYTLLSGKRAVDYDFVFKNKDSFFNQMREKCEYYHSFKENEKILNNEHVDYHLS